MMTYEQTYQKTIIKQGRRMLWMAVMGAILVWSAAPGIALYSNFNQRGQAYQISPKPCWVDEVEGTCMFVWECIKSEGYHIGMCVDTFMFGSCCAYNTSENAVLPNISPNRPSVLYTPTSHISYSTQRPVHRPSSSRPRPTRPTLSNIVISTKKPQRVSTSLFIKQTSGTTSPTNQYVPPINGLTSANSMHTVFYTVPGWQSTTEPGFVTKSKTKPSSNLPKQKPTKKPFYTSTGKNTIKFSRKTTTTTTTSPTTSVAIAFQNVSHNAANITNTVTKLTPINTTNIECGMPQMYSQPQTRIVGGKNAPFGRWPWQVSVRRTSFFGFSSTHRCGGAVLNENWIATAGHCVDDLLTSQIRIRVGEYDFSNMQEELPYVERAVSRKVVHPKYNFFTYEYDLALVQLDKSIKFAPHIKPICLPASDDLLIGENATVTGWGRLSEGGTLPSVLQEVQVPIVSNDRCKTMFLRAGRQEFIPEIFLCAGHENGGQDSCQGDSGGPLQVKGKDGRYFLAGIISWGIGCAEENLPGVCTRISKFVPWILKNVT